MITHDDTGFYWEHVPDMSRDVHILMVEDLLFIYRLEPSGDPHHRVRDLEVIEGADRVLRVNETLRPKALWEWALELLGES
jgi:hypothetical protein